jgi:hypothetical protein
MLSHPPTLNVWGSYLGHFLQAMSVWLWLLDSSVSFCLLPLYCCWRWWSFLEPTESKLWGLAGKSCHQCSFLLRSSSVSSKGAWINGLMLCETNNKHRWRRWGEVDGWMYIDVRARGEGGLADFVVSRTNRSLWFFIFPSYRSVLISGCQQRTFEGGGFFIRNMIHFDIHIYLIHYYPLPTVICWHNRAA